MSILALGSDPAHPGAQAWAARAKQRLDVVGDRSLWSGHRTFSPRRS